MKTKIINNIEYEIKTHDYGKKLSEIKIPKGWRLLKPSEAMMLWEKNNFTDWFFVENPFQTECIARFNADSYWAWLCCYRYPSYCYASIGVRFCRDLKKIKRTK